MTHNNTLIKINKLKSICELYKTNLDIIIEINNLNILKINKLKKDINKFINN